MVLQQVISLLVGVRQGDPISPYIFILVMEILFGELDKAILTNQIRPIKHKGDYSLNHLLFADDIQIFRKADRASLLNLELILLNFANASRWP